MYQYVSDLLWLILAEPYFVPPSKRYQYTYLNRRSYGWPGGSGLVLVWIAGIDWLLW